MNFEKKMSISYRLSQSENKRERILYHSNAVILYSLYCEVTMQAHSSFMSFMALLLHNTIVTYGLIYSLRKRQQKKCEVASARF